MRTEVAAEIKTRENWDLPITHVYCHSVHTHCSLLNMSEVPISISKHAGIQHIYRPSYSHRGGFPVGGDLPISLRRMGSSVVQDSDTDLIPFHNPPPKKKPFHLFYKLKANISFPWFLPTPDTQFSSLGDEETLNYKHLLWNRRLPGLHRFLLISPHLLWMPPPPSWLGAQSRKPLPCLSASGLAEWWLQSAGTLPSGHTLASVAIPPHWGSWEQSQTGVLKAAVWSSYLSEGSGNFLAHHCWEVILPQRQSSSFGDSLPIPREFSLSEHYGCCFGHSGFRNYPFPFGVSPAPHNAHQVCSIFFSSLTHFEQNCPKGSSLSCWGWSPPPRHPLRKEDKNPFQTMVRLVGSGSIGWECLEIQSALLPADSESTFAEELDWVFYLSLEMWV